MDTLLAQLSGFKPFKALVLGDFMVDELVYGDAQRLSADAPVPVLQVRHIEQTPGGAANLCLALEALGASVEAVGVVGDDAHGRWLSGHLADKRIDTASLLIDAQPDDTGSHRPTTLKRNLVGLAQQRHPQKMFRVDYESTQPIAPALEQQLLDRITEQLPQFDCVCIEDYDKGVCTESLCQAVIAAARNAGVPVFVDPAKRREYVRYAGCTAITPNRNEAEFATGMATVQSDDDAVLRAHNVGLASALKEQLCCDAVVLTLDRHGALVFADAHDATLVPTEARQVYDVTGAGDVFVAALAAGRANGLDWLDATRFANAAAGLEVEAFGATPIPIERIHQQLLSQSTTHRGKLRTREELLIECKAWRMQGKRIVLTNGCFDVLHAGHVSLLDRAKALGDVLIVATNTDEQIRAFKGPNRPVNSLAQRAAVLGGLASVDAVVVFEEETPVELIKAIKPDVLVKGDEYTIEQIPGASFIQSYGGRVERLPMIEGYSSTTTLEKLNDPRAVVQTPVATRERFVQDQS